MLLRQPGFQLKKIEIKSGCRFSLQKHLKRAEKWLVATGRARITLGARQFIATPGSFIDVPRGRRHRVENVGRNTLVLIELQLGKHLAESDIIRFADDYGRA